jgi:hypothetical protein
MEIYNLPTSRNVCSVRLGIRLHFTPSDLGGLSASGSGDHSLGQAAIDCYTDHTPAWTPRNTSSMCAKDCHKCSCRNA